MSNVAIKVGDTVLVGKVDPNWNSYANDLDQFDGLLGKVLQDHNEAFSHLGPMCLVEFKSTDEDFPERWWFPPCSLEKIGNL